MTRNAKELAERVLADLKTSSHPGKLDDYRDLCFDAAPKLARAVLELSEAHGIRELVKENERLRSDVEMLQRGLDRMTELRDEAEQRQDRYFGPAPPGHIYED